MAACCRPPPARTDGPPSALPAPAPALSQSPSQSPYKSQSHPNSDPGDETALLVMQTSLRRL